MGDEDDLTTWGPGGGGNLGGQVCARAEGDDQLNVRSSEALSARGPGAEPSRR